MTLIHDVASEALGYDICQ